MYRLFEKEGKLEKYEKYLPNKSVLSRIAYSSFIGIGFILALILREIKRKKKKKKQFTTTTRDGLYGALEWIPALKDGCDFAQGIDSSCIGKFAIYRISFALVILYTLNAFLSSKLFCVGDRIRLFIQYKLFLLNIPLWMGLTLVTFFIPNIFFLVYAWICVGVSGLFIVIQIILLIDFAFEWNEKWRSEEDEGYGVWDWLIVIFAVVLFLLSIGVTVVQFIVFGLGANCHLERFFICMTIILSILVTFASIFLSRGVLPPAVIVCFCVFTCWTSLLSDPDKGCNIIQAGASSDIFVQVITIVFGVSFACISLVRVAVSTTFTVGNLCSCGDGEKEDGETEEEKEEKNKLREECNAMFLSHVVFIFASFYLSMILSNWDIQATSHENWKIDESVYSMWVKIVSQWVTFGIYFWTLIAPIILGRCRNFDQ